MTEYHGTPLRPLALAKNRYEESVRVTAAFRDQLELRRNMAPCLVQDAEQQLAAAERRQRDAWAALDWEQWVAL